MAYPNRSIITLNINRLNNLINRDCHKELKNYHLQETHFKPEDIKRLIVNEWKKYMYYANRKSKKTAVAMCIWDKMDSKMWVELCFPRRYVEVLTTPGASECDLIWK